jgi:hypothetical protein
MPSMEEKCEKSHCGALSIAFAVICQRKSQAILLPFDEIAFLSVQR